MNWQSVWNIQSIRSTITIYWKYFSSRIYLRIQGNCKLIVTLAITFCHYVIENAAGQNKVDEIVYMYIFREYRFRRWFLSRPFLFHSRAFRLSHLNKRHAHIVQMICIHLHILYICSTRTLQLTWKNLHRFILPIKMWKKNYLFNETIEQMNNINYEKKEKTFIHSCV